MIPMSWRERLPDFLALTRLNRPIGIWLLMWPTLWALWIAGEGHPPARVVIVFMLGVVFMRAAGCAINDYADRAVDGQVRRTAGRPLATGRVTPQEALITFGVLLLLSASLLLWLNLDTFYWSFGAVALAVLYPFMKRWTYLPQVVLGMAFSWGIPMAWVAQGHTPDAQCWLLYATNLAWTVAYDTQYALCDREDDLKAGIKSTAILFGELDLAIIGGLQAMFLFGMLALGGQLHLGWTWPIGVLTAAGLFGWQAWHTRKREPTACLEAFLHNHVVGQVLFVALLTGWLARTTT